MNTLRHPIAALVIFGVLVSLCVGIYSNIEDNYQITDQQSQTLSFATGYDSDTNAQLNTTNTGNIMEQMKKFAITTYIEQITNGIVKATNPASLFDLVGGLSLIGTGIAKLVINILVLPYSIVYIILTYYPFFPADIGGLIALVGVYISFILLSIYLKWKV